MKIYTATIKRDAVTVEYTVRAEDEKEAAAKIKKICGENVKVKEK